MAGPENTMRKNLRRLAAGAAGLGIAIGANELVQPNKPESDPMHDVDSRSDASGDTASRREGPRRVDLPAPLTLEDKIQGADPVLEQLLDKGYKDFTIATDGTTLEIYNADGEKTLNLWPLGDKWKVTVSPDSRVPEWSIMSGINLTEPIVSTGEDVQGLIDDYRELHEWRQSWTHMDTNTGLLSTIGTDQLPTTEAGRDEIQAKQEDELAKLENIILQSDNPLIEHSPEEAN